MDQIQTLLKHDPDLVQSRSKQGEGRPSGPIPAQEAGKTLGATAGAGTSNWILKSRLKKDSNVQGNMVEGDFITIAGVINTHKPVAVNNSPAQGKVFGQVVLHAAANFQSNV